MSVNSKLNPPDSLFLQADRVYQPARFHSLPTSFARSTMAPLPVDDWTGGTWGELFMAIDPYAYASVGLGLCMSLSIAGAAWGIWIVGTSLAGASVRAVCRVACVAAD
jgi:hypothetical protein